MTSSGSGQSGDDAHGEERHEYPDTLDVSDNAQHYYVKCLGCQEPVCDAEDAHAADSAARRHAGVHGGLYGDEAEIVITNHNGRELRRFHSFYKEDQYEDLALWECSKCGERHTWSDGASCPSCGHIREEHRLESENGVVE